MSDTPATPVATSLLAGLEDSEAVRKLTEVQNLLDKHFHQTGVEQATELAQFIVESIIRMGGTTSGRLGALSYEDLDRVYGHSCRLFKFNKEDTVVPAPVFLNKDIARIFRAGVTAEGAATEPIGRKKAAAMSEKELVEAYSPRLTNPVSDRLKELSKGRAFIILSDTGDVLVEPTLELLKELQKGHEARKALQYKGVVYTPLLVGQTPPEMVDENPLYPDNPLRPDGTCDQTGRSWASVPLEIRQFCRIAWGGKIASISEAHTVLDRVMSALTAPEDKRLQFLFNYALAGGAEFTDCKRMGTLPKLKLPLKPANVSGFTIHGIRK